MSEIGYKSSNGYYGVLYGKSGLIVYDTESVISFHTGSRKINTYEELVDFVDKYPNSVSSYLDYVRLGKCM